MSTPAPQPEPLCVDQDTIARMFGVSAKTIFLWRQREGMPHFKIGAKGGTVRFDVQEVREWMRARRVVTTTAGSEAQR
ncbi:MAG: helix-turn-helix domain-containing protein [Planctomycetes bacterium]|nr:helix-turn-helix domain-containing protein [Planctomycetota bacterium]